MLNFTFHNPTVIYFGKGQVTSLVDELKKRSKKLLIVTGRGSVKENGIFAEVIEQVEKAGIDYAELAGVQPNPCVSSVYEGIEICRKEKVDLILAVGGGSVIDASKTIAAGVKYEGDVWDFFTTEKRPDKALPVGTVLTLAASGSEMNPNAVIKNEDTGQKVAISSPALRPVFSILDPVYTFTVPKYHTAAGVADIMAHIFEYYLSPVPHKEVQDALSEGLLRTCIRFGPVVCEDPHNYEARANIMWASTLAMCGVVGRGGMCDWTCHAIEHELSGIYDISHGVGLAVLLPGFMEVVMEKYGHEKFIEYATNVWEMEPTDPGEDAAEAAIARTRDFFRSIELPSKLNEINITNEHFEKMARKVIQQRGETGEFEQLTEEEIRKVLYLSL
ncbi:MAG: iron-containing alcohol dehydrogenase [Candidatus Omnitrophota bacterium]|nr:iron-containing alcohol dehydrogenase [Candidatus Omnitrophota bacterium]